MLKLHQKHIGQLSIELKNKNILIVPPIFLNDKLMSDFQEEASQCTPEKNASRLSKFKYKSAKRLTSIEISEDNVIDVKSPPHLAIH